MLYPLKLSFFCQQIIKHPKELVCPWCWNGLEMICIFFSIVSTRKRFREKLIWIFSRWLLPTSLHTRIGITYFLIKIGWMPILWRISGGLFGKHVMQQFPTTPMNLVQLVLVKSDSFFIYPQTLGLLSWTTGFLAQFWRDYSLVTSLH